MGICLSRFVSFADTSSIRLTFSSDRVVNQSFKRTLGHYHTFFPFSLFLKQTNK